MLDAASDQPSRGAVSAVEGHFVFHLSTQSGAKAVTTALCEMVARADGEAALQRH